MNVLLDTTTSTLPALSVALALTANFSPSAPVPSGGLQVEVGNGTLYVHSSVVEL